MTDSLLPTSPAADRNKGPILDVLSRWLAPSASGRILEIAAGTGQHAAHFAEAFAGWQWLPTDADPRMLPVIAAHCAHLPNVGLPQHLDVQADPWPFAAQSMDAVYCANMIHISPWTCTEGLMRGAAQVLRPGGSLVLYGPYIVEGEALAPSNAAFDQDLKRRNPAWGLRSLAAVTDEARAVGLALQERVDMPANNLLLRWQRA